MTTVELIYDRDCPNAERARSRLLEAFVDAGVPPRWIEWQRDAPDSPVRVRAFGSPTVLVDGKDVAPGAAAESASCRIYSGEGGCWSGAPPVSAIARALRRRSTKPPGFAVATVVPTLGLALLPTLTCPLCWPAYATALSALGIGFIDYTPYLAPLSAAFVSAFLAALLWRAIRTSDAVPLAIGIGAAAVMLGGKFVLESEPLTYVGGAGLLIALALFHRRGRALSCPACAPARRKEV